MTTRKQLAKDLAAEKGISKREAMRQVKAFLDVVGKTTTIEIDQTERVVDLTKSEFERRLDAEVEAEAITGKGSKRCLTCGNLWQYCTCGGKSPLDCEKCHNGRGKGDVIGVDRFHRQVREDRLCPKHQVTGRICLNRSEKRAALKRAGRLGKAKRRG